jgi:hypothetical protein
MRVRAIVPGLLVSAVIAAAGAPGPEAAEVAGVITEIKPGAGAVEVRPAGSADWRPAGPLMSLGPGDAVRASGGASAVILLAGARGTLRVEPGAPPVVVPGPQTGDGKVDKARGLLAASLGFLSSRPRELPQTFLGTRGWVRPPVVLAPRNGPVLADSLTFDWFGGRASRYTLQIVAPAGLVLERANVPGASFPYPADGPRLVPGVRYTFRVLSESQPPQEAWFEVMSAEVTEAFRRGLGAVEQEAGADAAPSTLAALRVGYLASHGLVHEARGVLLAALTRDPDEPTLHLLLGNLYSQAGLPEQAGLAFDEARLLLSGRPRP